MALPKVPKINIDEKGLPQSGDPFELMLVHMMPSEATLLDAMQGGEQIDPETGLREYSQLGPIFANPEVEDVFLKITKMEQEGVNDDSIDALYNRAESETQKFEKTREDKFGPVADLEHEGRNGDTIMVLLPKNVVILFGIMRGGLTRNPKTGLFEFSLKRLVKNIVRAPVRAVSRVLQTVGVSKNHANEFTRALGAGAGYLFGGPLGAAAGNAYANYGTGKTLGSSLVGGAKIGALHYAADQVPAMMAGLGKLGTMGTMGAAAGTGAAAGAGTAGAAGAGAAGAGAAAAGSGGLSGMLGGMTLPMGLLAAHHGLGMIGEHQKYKHEKEDEERQRRENDEHLRKMGVYEGWTPPEPQRMRMNPRGDRRTSDEMDRGIFPHPLLQSYKKGGAVQKMTDSADVARHSSKLIKGAGKGQADKIRTSVANGSYIVDASSVSMLGDGSSEEGAKVLQRYLNKLKAPSKADAKPAQHASGGQVPVFVSNDEFEVVPQDVDKVGSGSNDKGSYILKGIVKELRKHKRSNGDRLPPRAKDPAQYAKLSRRT